MTPTDDLRLTLRMNLDETIPPGGTDADTMFTNAEIDNLLMQSQTIEEASWRGWVIKGIRLATASAGGLVQAQMGAEQFKWADPSDLFKLCQDMAKFWFDQIPPGLAPDVGGNNPRILTIYPVPVPGVNVPSDVPSDIGYTTNPWAGTPDQPWWPGDMSRLLSYIKAGWRWPSAEVVVATVPE